jgi:chromosome segregation ATPase
LHADRKNFPKPSQLIALRCVSSVAEGAPSIYGGLATRTKGGDVGDIDQEEAEIQDLLKRVEQLEHAVGGADGSAGGTEAKLMAEVQSVHQKIEHLSARLEHVEEALGHLHHASAHFSSKG